MVFEFHLKFIISQFSSFQSASCAIQTYLPKQIIDKVFCILQFLQIMSLYLHYSGLYWTSMKGHAIRLVMLVHAGIHTKATAALGARM